MKVTIPDFDLSVFGVSAVSTITAPTTPGGLLSCTSCGCRSEARQVVPGVGPTTAPILFLGQNPGSEEDEEGRPFLGASGREFDGWLEILGLVRDKVYITNVVKCHTAGNRVPRASEIQTCSNLWFGEELAALPALTVLVPLGKPAITRVLGKSAPPLTPPMIYHLKIRVGERPMSVFPLPHPAFFLRTPHLGPVFRDILLPQVRHTLQQEFPAVYTAAGR